MSFAIRAYGPQIIVKSTGTTLTLSLYDMDTNELATLSSVTVAVYDEGGTLVTSGSATIASNVASFAVTSGSVSDQEYSQFWTVEWTTNQGIFVQNAALARINPHCSIITQDIFNNCREIHNGEWRDSQNNTVDWGSYIDESYKEFYGRLCNVERWPWMVMNPHSFRSFLLNYTLMRIYESLMSDGNERYEVLADRFKERADEDWNRIQLMFDASETRSRQTKSTSPVIYLTGAPTNRYWRY